MEYYICVKCLREYKVKPSKSCETCGGKIFKKVRKEVKRVRLIEENTGKVALFYGEGGKFGRAKARIFKELAEGIGEEEFIISIRNGEAFINKSDKASLPTIFNNAALDKEMTLKDGDLITIGFLSFRVKLDWTEKEIGEFNIGGE